ncbi:1922_t:CDS:2 [Paraglomus occultum]|uniref:1922_t:CDS:1 n=1 Tax=Paraglomus occultum TaxID=144539 RepID=A0A9N9AIH5_9GLOM|nr:1922_t:CDS:2 [Paraglomus occultum]
MRKNVNVIGAGVSGLTTALELQNDRFQVTVIADRFPGDLSIDYCSPNAGAQWRGDGRYAPGSLDAKIHGYTFKKLYNLAETVPASSVTCMNLEEYVDDTEASSHKDPWFKDLVPNVIPQAQLPAGAKSGISYTTVAIDVPKYLKWLLQQFIAAGGKTQRCHLAHVKGAFGENVDVVVNCTGIRARTLGGIEDQTVYPTRGQTILVWAPHVKSMKTLTNAIPFGYSRLCGISYIDEDVVKTDMRPLRQAMMLVEIYLLYRRNDFLTPNVRMASSGNVILGGTMDDNRFDLFPDKEIAEGIIRRCTALYPALTAGKELEIISHNVGLRPSRVKGLRLETEIAKNAAGKEIIICHNYGHHSYGYQASWGASNEALQLIKKALSSQGKDVESKL